MEPSPETRALEALRGVIDPEIGLDVVELGLVYAVEVDAGTAHVRMTTTSPACPLGEQIVAEAEARLREVDGIDDADIELVWDPPWTPERMSAGAKEVLGWTGR